MAAATTADTTANMLSEKADTVATTVFRNDKGDHLFKAPESVDSEKFPQKAA